MAKLTSEEMLEKRNTAVMNMRSVLNRAKDAGRDTMEPAEETEYNGYKKEVVEWNAKLDASKKADEEEKFLAEQEAMADKKVGTRRTEPSDRIGNQQNEPRQVNWNPLRESEANSRFNRYNERQFRYNPVARGSREYQQGFESYLRSGNTRGMEALGIDPSTYIAAPYNPEGQVIPEPGGLQSDSDDRGGYLVPSESFMEGLLKAVDDQTRIYQLARNIIVRNSASLGIRCLTQKMQSWDWGSELSDALLHLDDNMRFGKKNLTPHYATGSARLSRDLMRMSTLDSEQLVYSELARDLSYLIEQAGVSGNGVQKPLGVLTASADGINTDRDFSTDTTATTFTFETFMGAKYFLKSAYRNRARWMFNRTFIADIAMIRTDSGAGAGTGSFIWQPSMQVGSPDVLLGLPVDENEFFPTATGTGAYWGLLAVWEYYVFAVGLDMEVQRCVETRASKNQIEYVARAKIDGMPTLSEAFVRLAFGS